MDVTISLFGQRYEFADVVEFDKLRETIEFVGVREYAEESALSDSYVRRLCRDGRIRDAYMVEGKWLVPRYAVPDLKWRRHRRDR